MKGCPDQLLLASFAWLVEHCYFGVQKCTLCCCSCCLITWPSFWLLIPIFLSVWLLLISLKSLRIRDTHFGPQEPAFCSLEVCLHLKKAEVLQTVVFVFLSCMIKMRTLGYYFQFSFSFSFLMVALICHLFPTRPVNYDDVCACFVFSVLNCYFILIYLYSLGILFSWFICLAFSDNGDSQIHCGSHTGHPFWSTWASILLIGGLPAFEEGWSIADYGGCIFVLHDWEQKTQSRCTHHHT